MHPTLLVIDIQNDYFPGGKMDLFEMESAAANAQKLILLFRKNNWPVVFIQHLATKPNATFFLPGTSGAEIHESIHPIENETVIVKKFPNSFRDTNLNQHLQSNKYSDLVICGAMSHMCVDTTVRAASDFGYNCTLISDACATRNLIFNDQNVEATQVQTAFMAALNGTFAEVLTTANFLGRIKQAIKNPPGKM